MKMNLYKITRKNKYGSDADFRYIVATSYDKAAELGSYGKHVTEVCLIQLDIIIESQIVNVSWIDLQKTLDNGE
jgi:hypothetical protein